MYAGSWVYVVVDCPVRALAPVCEGTSDLDEAGVEREVVSDRVLKDVASDSSPLCCAEHAYLPSCRSCAEVGKLSRIPYVRQRQRFDKEYDPLLIRWHSRCLQARVCQLANL
jgi:hypothetical protein